ncbi:MAG: hypothetical protein ACKVUT_16100 [Gaiella sp.]
MSRLEESIEQLYLAFASVPRPATIDACPCCVPEDETCQLTAVSNVRTISSSLLASYASSAFLTAGSAADYLYYLPRILHISATDDSWWPDPEVTGRAIKAAEPDNWQADQRSAVDSFFTAVIHASLDPDRHHVIDSWMCAIARSGFPVQPRLAAIEKNKSAVLSYFNENAETLPQRKLINAFWDLPCVAHNTIVNWFYSEPVRTIVATEYGYVFPKGS